MLYKFLSSEYLNIIDVISVVLGVTRRITRSRTLIVVIKVRSIAESTPVLA